jgi:hypothetical protein
MVNVGTEDVGAVGVVGVYANQPVVALLPVLDAKSVSFHLAHYPVSYGYGYGVRILREAVLSPQYRGPFSSVLGRAHI